MAIASVVVPAEAGAEPSPNVGYTSTTRPELHSASKSKAARIAAGGDGAPDADGASEEAVAKEEAAFPGNVRKSAGESGRTCSSELMFTTPKGSSSPRKSNLQRNVMPLDTERKDLKSSGKTKGRCSASHS